jgi:dinuclear metal center YbgI/SA1388 family protein
MVKRDELIKFIYDYFGEELMRKAESKDDMANGVQIHGGDEVKKVTLCVTINEDFLLEAIANGSNFCISHHGLDPRVYKNRIPKSTQKRLKIIFDHEITVAGFHYILDVHPQIGNNAAIIKSLGAKIGDSLFEEWGYTATFSMPQEVKNLAQKCSKLFEHDILAIYSGPKKVKTIGVCSGAAKPYARHIAEMEEKGVELFISGETSESIPNRMKESDINYFVGGHYATEVFGIQELGKVIKSQFKDKIEVEFIDIPNPV